MSDRRFVSIYDQTLGSFRGAADLVMGMESQVRERRNQDLAAGALMQRMEFDRAIQPLRLGLLREQIASQHMQGVLDVFRLGQLRHADEAERGADAAVHAGFRQLFQEFSAYRGGGVGQSLGIGAAADEPDTAGTVDEPDSGGSVYQPGMDGAFGEDMPIKAPAGSDSEAGSLLPSLQADPEIPFSPDGGGPDGGVVEGSGDGPGGPLSIVDRELAARRAKGGSIVERELAARAGKQGGVATAPVVAGSVVSSPVPRSVILKKKFELMMQAAGGQHGMATRFQQWLPKVAEAVATLAFDPEAANWERNQAALVQRQKDKAAVIGKVVSAGLPEEDFAPVLRAIEMGIPVDPATIDERIKAGYKLREEQAKLKASKAESLTGYLVDPVTAPLARAGLSIFSRAEKSKAEGMRAALSEFLQRGDVEGARGLLKSAAVDLAPTAIQNEYAASAQMANAVNDAKAALEAHYKKHGEGSTGPVIGRQLSDYTGSTHIQALRTRLALSRQAYTKAMTGASFSDQERQTYERMFPSETKTKNTNLAQIGELTAGLESRRQNAANAAFGDLASVLNGSVAPVTLLDAAQPLVFSTPEELSAAVASGTLRPGQKLSYQGRIIRYKGKS